MHNMCVYFNNIGSLCTDILRNGNGLFALLLSRAAKRSAAKRSRAKHAPWKACHRFHERTQRTLLCDPLPKAYFLNVDSE